MLTRFFSVLLLAWLPLATAHAQTATGRVVAKATGTPLPQTTVRLDGQPAGVRTDEAGRFQLPLAGAAPDARLVISHLGCETQTVAVAKLGPTAEVSLVELTYEIGEVFVTYTNVRKLLLRKWRIDEGSLDAAVQRMVATVQKKDPEKAAKLARKPGAARSVFQKARYTFYDDGSVKAKVLLLGSSGRWELDEVERKLTVTDSSGAESLVTVVELTDQRLVLKRPNTDLPPVVYVPAD